MKRQKIRTGLKDICTVDLKNWGLIMGLVVANLAEPSSYLSHDMKRLKRFKECRTLL